MELMWIDWSLLLTRYTNMDLKAPCGF